jgi:hypothetical protein
MISAHMHACVNLFRASRELQSAQRGYPIPRATTLILGGESHKVGQEGRHRTSVTALESWAAQRLHMRDPAYRWSAQDYVSVDGIPYVIWGYCNGYAHRLEGMGQAGWVTASLFVQKLQAFPQQGALTR